MALVDDVVQDWTEMDGDTPRAQQLNALLTATFILRSRVLPDECLGVSHTLIEMWDRGANEEEVADYLVRHFASDPEGRLISKAMEINTRSAYKERVQKLAKGPLSDREFLALFY